MSAPTRTDRKGESSIAIVGDLHSAWEPEDIAYFNRRQYPALLLTGDLGRSRSQDGRRIARALTDVESDVLVMPGNNDVEEYPHIRAELTYQQARADLLADTAVTDSGARTQPRTAQLCGYSLHPLVLPAFPVTVVAGRPFSMGGPELAYPEALAHHYGVRSMEESFERLRVLIDAVTTSHVVFLAHNGPTGLGARTDDLWGRDFGPTSGDWGDPDLRAAIAYATQRGLTTLAVVAGHMHWHVGRNLSPTRRWQTRRNGILYINAARVPRVFQHGEATVYHHIELRLQRCAARAYERCIADTAEGERLSAPAITPTRLPSKRFKLF
jgi:uncharacterized protein (TIGR04168 family)